MNLKKKTLKIHFIGIGGIGVSALARYYLEKGDQVSGSDLVASEIIEELRKRGARIFIGKHKEKNLSENTDLVIFSPAVPKENPELKKAKKLKIPSLSYPQALGKLTKKYFTIAVSGTHGKSTVTAMIGLILKRASFNPTVIVGTKLKEFGNSNFRMGSFSKKSPFQFLVIEADEYRASFLNYWPKIIVLTTLEPDHLDYYKNFKNYILAFRKFISHLPKDGYLVANKDDPTVYTTFSTIVKNVVWYSLKDKESNKIRKLLKIPGEFNVSNALAALRVAQILKIPNKISFKTLSQYKGSWRRFEEKWVKLNAKKFKLISDYAHHPTEIKVTLKTAREKYRKKKIWCIFQPHQFQRTYYLFDEFVQTFKEAIFENWTDNIIITDIYEVSGREDQKIKEKISSEKLVREIAKESEQKNKILYLPFRKIIQYLKENLEGGEVVIMMGAGDIYNLTKRFKK